MQLMDIIYFDYFIVTLIAIAAYQLWSWSEVKISLLKEEVRSKKLENDALAKELSKSS